MKKQTTIIVGIVLLGIELVFLIFWLIVNSSFAAKILSMVAANHLGGRLAFIGVGLENGLSSYLIIAIIVFYNTTYLLLMYSIFVFFSERVKKLKFIRNYIESIQNKAKNKKRLFKKWNWFGLSLFVWIPLPWTGAVIGSYIAHLEGYDTREAFLIVIPSMWVGIISWTLWFDELYGFIEQFGKGRTIFLTIFLLIIPIIYFVLGGFRKNK
jgi:uncharacterized membrane protein